MEEVKKTDVKSYDGFYNRVAKRLLDILISGIALCVIWPILLVIAVIVAAEDGLPVFYRAPRGGYKGRPFQICKFRSMVKNADKIGGGTTALHDPRITKAGIFLRKTKLDELPQLGQVFLGKMSLVGPRPELLRYVEAYEGEERLILEVRPGITDYSSVEFVSLDEIVGPENADEMYERYVLKRKNQLRLQYVYSVSLKTDVKILLMTAKVVIGKVFRLLLARGKMDKKEAKHWNTYN